MVLGEKHKVLGKVVGFKDDNQNRPIFEATKEIKVKIFDWTPLIERLKKSDKTLKDLNISIRAGKGVIFVPSDDNSEMMPIIIDKECCGIDSETKNIFVNGKSICGDFIQGVGIFVVNEGFIPIIPKYYFDFDFDDIKKCYTGEEKELWDFMDSRYMYNPRIEKNMIDIVKLYNKQNAIELA